MNIRQYLVVDFKGIFFREDFKDFSACIVHFIVKYWSLHYKHSIGFCLVSCSHDAQAIFSMISVILKVYAVQVNV